MISKIWSDQPCFASGEALGSRVSETCQCSFFTCFQLGGYFGTKFPRFHIKNCRAFFYLFSTKRLAIDLRFKFSRIRVVARVLWAPSLIPLGRLFPLFLLFSGIIGVGFWQNGFFTDFSFEPPDFCLDFVAGLFLHYCGIKCPEKSSRKIPGKILQNLYNKNPRQLSAEGPGQK